MTLSIRLIYEDVLRCGNEVANRGWKVWHFFGETALQCQSWRDNIGWWEVSNCSSFFFHSNPNNFAFFKAIFISTMPFHQHVTHTLMTSAEPTSSRDLEWHPCIAIVIGSSHSTDSKSSSFNTPSPLTLTANWSQSHQIVPSLLDPWLWCLKTADTHLDQALLTPICLSLVFTYSCITSTTSLTTPHPMKDGPLPERKPFIKVPPLPQSRNKSCVIQYLTSQWLDWRHFWCLSVVSCSLVSITNPHLRINAYYYVSSNELHKSNGIGYHSTVFSFVQGGQNLFLQCWAAHVFEDRLINVFLM